MSLGDQLRAAVMQGFEAQASAYGAALQTEAMERRKRDPLAVFLLDTFTRQVTRFGLMAREFHARGERRRAVEYAMATERALENKRRVEAAIRGEDDGTERETASGIPNWQGAARGRR